jgi:hypothetical protein
MSASCQLNFSELTPQNPNVISVSLAGRHFHLLTYPSADIRMTLKKYLMSSLKPLLGKGYRDRNHSADINDIKFGISPGEVVRIIFYNNRLLARLSGFLGFLSFSAELISLQSFQDF